MVVLRPMNAADVRCFLRRIPHVPDNGAQHLRCTFYLANAPLYNTAPMGMLVVLCACRKQKLAHFMFGKHLQLVETSILYYNQKRQGNHKRVKTGILGPLPGS